MKKESRKDSCANKTKYDNNKIKYNLYKFNMKLYCLNYHYN